ncbi:hypothetical protein Pint_10093 [Pistacia integerrima]|uniref:Uncharacterized protein n=1 Tax=Pistacia integerrima TaxID=434235 RepID=A0ACC0XNE3_9ROSI|nr:hypothetical protein Pint_10093 [Pistacia integerrima]
MVTGERQAARIRGLYLKTILRQDIAFFDTKTSTGEVIGRMSGDTILIQGWLLALVLLSCIPAVVIVGGIMSMMLTKMSSSGQIAYADAGNVVEQTVGAIRTVASFTGEKQAIEKYNSKLQLAYAATNRQGLASGVALGTQMLLMFGTYALAMWSLGTHEELIQDPKGGYSGLIRLQEGAKEGVDAQTTDADKSDTSFDIMEKIMTGSRSHRVSTRTSMSGGSSSRRSGSGGSSGSRHSFSFSYNFPGTISLYETNEDGKKVVHQQISWFDDSTNSSGAIGARLSIDASTVQSLVGDTLALIVQNIATITVGLVIALTANWILAFIILAVSPVMLIQRYFQTKFLKDFSANAKLMYEEASQVANDAVGSIRTVASFCTEKKVMDLYQKKCDAPMKQGARLGLVSGGGFGFSYFALHCSNAFCFYIGSILVHHGKATFGEVFKVFFALTIAANCVSETTGLAPDTNKAKDSVTSIYEILDNNPKIDSSSNEGMTLTSIRA